MPSSQDPPDPFPHSAAGWSEVASDPAVDESALDAGFATSKEYRYRRGDEIGRGGMGRVYQSTDLRLGREVALKEIAPHRETPEFVDRLVREAQLTAYLDHPNIVPVYDAGNTEKGRIFYTMRLIRGRSLALAIGDGWDREKLLRHYLDTCHALAFAHSRGVVHRDLKPANIMVGEFGETQVVDWGLAGLTETAVQDPALGKLGKGPSGPLGTQKYMAPEQASEAAAPQADVYSLGLVLRDIVGSEAESEINAIIEKARATVPSKRYSDAAALSEDVARYLDGQRVLAHSYTAGELLARLVRLWRVPLAIGAIAFLALAIAITLVVTRISRERSRATGAEAAARQALGESHRALNRQALAAFEDQANAEAEIIAAHALAHGEFPDARGVLAAIDASSRPTESTSWTLGDCRYAEPAANGFALCLDNNQVALWQLGETAQEKWRHAATEVRGYLSRTRVTLISTDSIRVLDQATGKQLFQFSHEATFFEIDRQSQRLIAGNNRRLWVYELEQGVERELVRPCDPDLVTAVAASPGRVVALCRSGKIVVYSARSGERTHLLSTPFSESRRALTLAISPDGEQLAVGGAKGGVVTIAIADNSPSALQTFVDSPILQLQFFADDYLLVLPEAGAATMRAISSGAGVLQLPAGAHRLVVRDDQIIAAGARVAQWTIDPETLTSQNYFVEAGLSTAILSPDGDSLVVARGDGVINVWARKGARRIAELPVDAAVIKQLAFGLDGKHLVAATASQLGDALVDTSAWQVESTGVAKQPLRRIGVMEEQGRSRVVGIPYTSGLVTWPLEEEQVQKIEGPSFVDMHISSDHKRVTLLDDEGGIWSLDQDLKLASLRSIPGAIAVAGASGAIVVATRRGVHLFRGEGMASEWFPSTSGELVDVAISPDLKLIAAASRRGTVDLWRSDNSKVVAILRGHQQRVAHIRFTDSSSLLSASWDGHARLWNFQDLAMPAEERIAAARKAWGLSLDEALHAWPLGIMPSPAE